MQGPENIKLLIDKYLAGKASITEMAEVDQWFAQLRIPPIENGVPVKDDVLKERIYTAILSNIHKSTMPVRISKLWRIAAALIPAAVLAAGAFYLLGSRHKPLEPNFKDLYTREGGMSRIMLVDSSVVWLNAGSHLRYPEAFKNDNRFVYLEGEAYFEIKDDPKRPFIIESGKYHTKVLGTSFNIRSYHTPAIYKVTVATGKVAVYNLKDTSHPVLLTANQELRVNDSTGTQEVRTIHIPRMSWKDGVLAFEKDPLSEVITSLQRRYSVHFRFATRSLQAKEISGTFDYNQPLDDILKILSKVYNLHFRKQPNGMYTIS